VSEAVPLQRGVKQIARIIASERAPRPVGASETRRQAHDQDFGLLVAERRNRRVKPFRMGYSLRFPKRDKPRAKRTVVRRFRQNRHT
jgi:hypothetical protein